MPEKEIVKPKPIDIAWRVRRGERTKAELRKCGCPECMDALKILAKL